MSGRAPSACRGAAARRVVARLILLAIEGPKRPRWAFNAMVIVAVVLVATVNWLPSPLDRALFLPSLVMLAVVVLWMFARYCVYLHYRALAEAGRSTRCLNCGYPLRGLPGPRCPECGADSDEIVRRARRLVWKQGVDPDVFSDEGR